MSSIGFIGLGIMGRPMAGHLQQAGHDILTVEHNSPTPPELIEGGAEVCATPADVARRADIIIIMVPDTPDVETVLLGESGVVDGLSEGKLVIDMSSISPIATRNFAQRVNELGCEYVDAPVSGGEAGARNAALTIMVGASEAGFASARPVLEVMGRTITHIGDNGAGQTCKVANQIVVALTIEAVGEGLLFASRAGADVSRVREALLGGLAQSKIMEMHGERMIKRTFDPGFRIELHQKDLNLALQEARSLGLALPGTALAQELFNACTANGGATWDHAGIVRALEQLANYEIGD